MNAGSVEPEAASAAANFVASVLASVMDRRGEAVPPISLTAEQSEIGAELMNDRDLDESLLGPQDCALPESMSPTSSSPMCMQLRGDSRQIVDTPSTEMGLSPSPGGWRSQPSTSHSFDRGRGVITPAPRAATSLAMRASTAMDYVHEQHEEMAEASMRASTSLDYARESQHEEITESFSQSPGEAFVPSPPRTAPGARRPRGSSLPLVVSSIQVPVGPVEPVQSSQEKETREDYDQLAARLSARQFLSGIVLGKVLALGTSASLAQRPLDQDLRTCSPDVLESGKAAKVLTSSSFRSEDLPGFTSETDSMLKIEGVTSSSSASRPPAPRGNKALARDKAAESPQTEPSSSQASSRPRSRQATVRLEATRKAAVPESPRQRFRKQSLQEAPPKPEVKKRRASDVSAILARETAGNSSSRINTPRYRPSPAPSPTLDAASSKPIGKSTQETCRCCGSVFLVDALFCRKCGSRRPPTPQDKEKVPQESSTVQECACGNVFKPDSSFCRKCGAPRPTEKSTQARTRRRSTMNSMVKKSRSQKNRGEADAGHSTVASPEDEDDLLSYYDFDIHGGTFGVLGVDNADGCDPRLYEIDQEKVMDYESQFDEYGNPLVLQQGEMSEEQAQDDWHSLEGLQEDIMQMQGVHNHHVAFQQDQYQWAMSEPYTTSQAYVGHGHAELSLACDPHALTVGSCVPLGWASQNPYDSLVTADSYNAVADLNEYSAYGHQASAKLEATVSGQQLGHLLASSCGMNLFSSQPVTLTLDEHTAAAVYAAAGVSLDAFDHVHEHQYDSELTNAELAAEEEALLASADLPIAEEELDAERRAQTGRRGRESTNAEQDLVVVKAKGSSAPGVTRPRADVRRSVVSEAASLTDSRRNTGQAPECSASGLQVESVRLLEDLNGLRSRGAGLNLQSKRPKSVGRVLDTSARMSPLGRASSGEMRSQKNNLQNRPTWNTAFMNIHERRIPRYDALIDGHCPVMTSPVRLKQVLQTRDMSSEYLHIVRSRFESHRRFFDPEHKLGDRSRPESTTPQKVKTDNARLPATFMKRVTELQGGDSDAWDENGDVQSGLLAPDEEQVVVAPSLASSTEWHDMPLYYQCLKEWKGDVADGLPSLCSPDNDTGSANEELPVRWERLRGRIELLWRELLISPDVRAEINDGPFTAMTANSVYRLEMHQKELLEFRLSTKRIIHDCLEHDAIFEVVQHSHALGVNDSRLTSLRDSLVVLNRLGTSLVRAIGVWSRRFGHLVVDMTKLPFQEGQPKPRAVFVWKGRDMVGHIQTVSDALSGGSLPRDMDSAVEQETLAGDASTNAAKSNGRRGSAASKEKDKKIAPASSPLVSLAMVSQKFSVNDVLHEGPPPTWYHPRIARAGIAAIRRGIPCGGGDKRE